MKKRRLFRNILFFSFLSGILFGLWRLQWSENDGTTHASRGEKPSSISTPKRSVASTENFKTKFEANSQANSDQAAAAVANDSPSANRLPRPSGFPASANLYRNAEVISADSGPGNQYGEFIRKRVLKTQFKYPLVLVEEKITFDPDNGQEVVLTQNAMVADHVLVKLNSGFGRASLEEVAARIGVYIRQALPSSGIYLLGFDGTDVHALNRMVQILHREGVIGIVEPDYIVHAN